MAIRNKEHEKKYHHEYYLRNKEKKQKQKAILYQTRKEYIKSWSRKRYLENKDTILERNKEYAMTEKARYSNLQRSALKRNYIVELTFEQFQEIINKCCTYCGAKELLIGIDREDNSIGYTLNNSKPCCKICNMMKHTNLTQDFLKKVEQIYNYQTNLNYYGFTTRKTTSI